MQNLPGYVTRCHLHNQASGNSTRCLGGGWLNELRLIDCQEEILLQKLKSYMEDP